MAFKDNSNTSDNRHSFVVKKKVGATNKHQKNHLKTKSKDKIDKYNLHFIESTIHVMHFIKLYKSHFLSFLVVITLLLNLYILVSIGQTRQREFFNRKKKKKDYIYGYINATTL